MAKDHSSNDAKKTPTKPPSRSATKQLSNAIGYLTRIAVACGLMVWGAFNAWTNVLEYRRAQEVVAVGTSSDWIAAFPIVAITSAIPLALGLWLLIKASGKTGADKRS